MGDGQKFWLKLWQLLAVVLVAFIICTSSCSAYKVRCVSKAIEGGADPIKVKVAFDGGGTDSRSLIAILLASEKKGD